MQLLAGMAYSDTIVLDVLKRLITASTTPGDVISQSRIADESGVPLTTCQYALRRLIKMGKIKSEFTPGIGRTYTIPSG
jgi:DNA-binding GntR family transcriptional regulator